VNLILSIILTSCLFLAFTMFKKLNISLLQAICVNYSVCFIVGFSFLYFQTSNISTDILPSLMAGGLAGFCFLPIFWIMGRSTQELGVTITSIANKTSMVIPAVVMLSIDPFLRSQFSMYKVAAIILSIGAIVLSNLKSKNESQITESRSAYLYPFIIFIGGAMVDLGINLASYYTSPLHGAWIPIGAFAAAAFSGIIVLSYQKIKWGEHLKFNSILGGIALGIPNYFSLHYVVQTLHEYHNDGATVYPLLNTGTILLNTFISILFFKEKINIFVAAGVIVAITAIFLMNV
jgi:drug/metabolite transporter (DMT)-like permease